MRVIMLMVLILLTACAGVGGGSQAAAPRSPVTPDAVETRATSTEILKPTEAVALTETATQAAQVPPLPSAAPALTAISPATATTTRPNPTATSEVVQLEAALFKGIPHGVTAEGFFYLGQPDAPVTMVDYSDFL
ncbi:MAG: hypothetical protein EXR62_09620 [Chloroflexi bacterium]|nr:hypothetical protein [Chloroflexota bacterium]